MNPSESTIIASNQGRLFPAEYFLNREASWLEFNQRVLEEAFDETNPLLERVKFLGIVCSNLDEFFMVRVAGVREQAFGDGAPQDFSADGLRPIDQLEIISEKTHKMVDQQYKCWNEQIRPKLAEEGIEILKPDELTESQKEQLDNFFTEQVFPVVTPMAIDPSHPQPRYHNRAIYLATLIERNSKIGPRNLFAVVQLPPVLPRLVELHDENKKSFIFLEDIIAARLPDLFGKCKVLGCTTFRITRDSDLEVLEQESDDMLRLIEERLKARRRGDAVRIEVSADADDALVHQIVRFEELRDDEDYREVYRVDGPVDLSGLFPLCKLQHFSHLKDEPLIQRTPVGLESRNPARLFSTIRNEDILLHHPYESFDPVVDFISRAANDPKVLAIKQTLYRAGGDSKIVKSLMQAAENGKHVTVLVELKARFDEATNVGWARQLERAGAHVVFGFLDLKTHCKVTMVIRQESDSLRRYVHLSTGNYNPVTAKLYTDLGLFTADEELTEDVSALFNLLTGYSEGHKWKKLLVAPTHLHKKTLEQIKKQTELAREGKPSWIFAKLNSLVDYRIIESLYEASQAGVKIDLVVRGICCLRPGLKGLSDNIRVISIVDRFLEHTRVFVFGPPNDEPEIYASSSDWMPRNFFRRVEVAFPIKSRRLRERILKDLVPRFLADNVKARLLQSDGTYTRVVPAPGERPYRSQVEFMKSEPVDEYNPWKKKKAVSNSKPVKKAKK